jgi:V8-like Glu-specific endopeptidase
VGRWAAVLVVIVGAACARPAEDPTARRLPIVGGSVDTGDPAVVAITYFGQDFCTGTLVAPRVVVTAAHCLDETLTGGVPFTDFDVFFGTETDAGGVSIHVSGGMLHPGWDADSLDNDIGVLALELPAPAEPVKMNRTAFHDGFVGRPLRIVGFGVTSATSTESGTKRQATSEVTSYDADDFHYGGTPGQTCFGDSGGPGFMTLQDGVEYLVGVTSWGDEECMFFGVDTRIDAYLDSFIQPFIDSLGPSDCGPDGNCVGGCTPPDPDCSGIPCQLDGVCETVGCPARDPDCFCLADGTCDLGCTPVDVDCTGDVPSGGPCASDYDCATGLCIAAADDPTFRYCSRACEADDNCTVGVLGGAMHCVETTRFDPDVGCSDEGAFTCVCSYDIPSPGSVGATCGNAGECRGGLCVPWEDRMMCSRACQAEGGGDCPLGYECGEMAIGDGSERVCVPAPPGEGWCLSTVAGRGGRGAGASLVLLALAVLSLRRRRR